MNVKGILFFSLQAIKTAQLRNDTNTNLSRNSVIVTLDNSQTPMSTDFGIERRFVQGLITKRAKRETPPGTYWKPRGPRVFVLQLLRANLTVMNSNIEGLKSGFCDSKLS